ncbi:MAG: DUF4118 domain-containing protein [Lachnospiraceae bacterium]|jgi:two-component system sensor histidine kinase KdpD|nr:DUF4118 domain-containing protein [Lachnospiraceae bacterium]
MTKQEFRNNIIITIVALGIATLLSYGFFLIVNDANNISLIYVLAIVLIARFTSGYYPGFIASFISVVIVNCVFTYPFGEVNFTMAGYPVTFIGMFSISVITSTTTSHLKTQAEMINERDKLLMEAEKEKMRANLLRAISHDLRTPLTAIIGSSSTYLENKTYLSEGEKDSLVEHIYEDSNWLLNMVENLLTVTRINANTASVVKTEESVEEVVGEAVTRLKKRLPDVAIRVKVPDEFYLIPMDATLIEQVIINLLENASRHSGTVDPIELNVWKNGKAMQFDVIDYGKGIAEERLDTIFDGTDTYCSNESGDTSRGIGIGLSICKTIISAHGGIITAANHGKGAKFSFTLPI